MSEPRGTLSTADVARLLDLTPRQVRDLVRAGLGRSSRRGRRYAFDFQDLVVLRAARDLVAAAVPPARVGRALAALQRELPCERPLSGMRIWADGKRVAVRDGSAAWEPETGQALFDFATDDLAESVRELRSAAPADADDEWTEADRAFERGIELEDEDPAGAAEAYARALQLDPELVDALVNLGRLAHEAGRIAEAERLYQEALRRSPEDPIVHFNLALALEDRDDDEGAIRHYQRALELDDDFADAHYNLAMACERRGRDIDAVRHYGAYKRLTEG